jgi:hypothetical protein
MNLIENKTCFLFRLKFIFIILVYGIHYKIGLLISMQENLKFILFSNIKISFKVKLISFLSRSFIFTIILALINDWASSVPPDIYSFTPFIYNVTVRGQQVEILVPCNQGNWIDCSKENDQQSAENSEENQLKSFISTLFYFSLYIIMR